MMKKTYLILSMIPLFFLSACNTMVKHTPAQNEPVALAASATTINEDLLQYINTFPTLAADAQKKELAQTNQLLAQDKGNLTLRAKSAIIYTIPGSRLRDNNKAQLLLDDLINTKSINLQQKSLFILLRDFSIENSKLASKARDDQRRADALQQKIDAAQQKLDVSQKKLDDLKSIEKTMIDRDVGQAK